MGLAGKRNILSSLTMHIVQKPCMGDKTFSLFVLAPYLALLGEPFDDRV